MTIESWELHTNYPACRDLMMNLVLLHYLFLALKILQRIELMESLVGLFRLKNMVDYPW